MRVMILILTLFLSLNAHSKTIELTNDNFVYYNTRINKSSAYNLANKIDNLNLKRGQKSYPLYIVIDSIGGDVFYSIITGNSSKVIPNLHFIAIKAHSAAFTLFQLSPGSRLMYKKGSLMVHPSIATLPYYNKTDFFRIAQDLSELNDTMIKINIAKTTINQKEYESLIETGEVMFKIEDAQVHNLADEYVDLKCAKTVKVCPKL